MITDCDPGDECDRCDAVDAINALCDSLFGPIDTHSVHVDQLDQRFVCITNDHYGLRSNR